MTLPSDFVINVASTTAALITDLKSPLIFIIGAIVLFAVTPHITEWFKMAGMKGKKSDGITYTYDSKGRLTGGYKK